MELFFGRKLDYQTAMPIEKIQGLVAAGFTPMKSDLSLDLPVIDRLADHLAESGVAGVFVCGSTGESLSLTTAERQACLERWRSACEGRIKVIAHVGHNSVADARELAAHAAEIGVDAISAMPPSFFKPKNLESLVDCCAAVAEAAPEMPFYYYHIPPLTGVAQKMSVFLPAVEERIPTFAGVKFTHSDLMDYRQCLVYGGGKFDILFGSDEIMLSALAMGAKGFIGSTYNLAPKLYLDVIAAFEAGKMEQAAELQTKSIEMVDRLIALGALPAFKSVMRLHGIDCGPIRLPFRAFTDEDHAAVAEAWNGLGIC